MPDDPTRRKWVEKSRRVVFDNRWITVNDCETIAPTGAPSPYGLVHFKNRAIGVLPIDEQGRTILIGQERFTFNAYSWELPEGGGRLDVPPIDAAKRELSEEAGLRAEHWLPLFADVQLSNSVTDELADAFIAWGLSPDTTWARDASEDLAVRQIPFAKAVSMAVSGEIQDAFSLVMLLKADHLLRTGALPGALQRLMQASD